MNQSRKKLQADFLRSLRVGLDKKGFISTGSDLADRKIIKLECPEFAIGDDVERIDEDKQGRIIAIYGKLCTVRPVKGNDFKSLTYTLRKL
jgi:hypothetical protein